MRGSKYSDLIKQARQPEDQYSGSTDSEAVPIRMVNLSIKVPESLRRHWVAEAKRRGMTITAVVTEALSAEFGQPENQKAGLPE